MCCYFTCAYVKCVVILHVHTLNVLLFFRRTHAMPEIKSTEIDQGCVIIIFIVKYCYVYFLILLCACYLLLL